MSLRLAVPALLALAACGGATDTIRLDPEQTTLKMELGARGDVFVRVDADADRAVVLADHSDALGGLSVSGSGDTSTLSTSCFAADPACRVDLDITAQPGLSLDGNVRGDLVALGLLGGDHTFVVERGVAGLSFDEAPTALTLSVPDDSADVALPAGGYDLDLQADGEVTLDPAIEDDPEGPRVSIVVGGDLSVGPTP